MNPEIIKVANNAVKSEATATLAKRLWPTMLFLIVMSVITAVAAFVFNKNNETSKLIAFWFWFVGQFVVTGFGIHAFLTDTKILHERNRHSPEDPSGGASESSPQPQN